MSNFILQEIGGKVLQQGSIFRKNGRLVLFGAHPDDAAMYATGIILLAKSREMHVTVVTVTDGSMGYTKSSQAIGLTERRRKQDSSALTILGVDEVISLKYPDASLFRHAGRRWVRRPTKKSPGKTRGLEGKLTRLFKKLQPDVVLTHSELGEAHIDHRTLSAAVTIALHHAFGGTWEEEGKKKLPRYPHLFHWMPYSGLPKGEIPDVLLRMPADAAKAKAKALSVYSDQKQVEHLMKLLLSAPFEYFNRVRLKGLNPREYLKHFPLPKSGK